MSFGLFIGDFLGDFLDVLKLVVDLSKALNESCGVSMGLRHLIAMLGSVEQAVNNAVQMAQMWNLAHPNPANKAPFSGLIEEHNIYRRLLEDFRKDSEKYTRSVVNARKQGET
jgi:hypothetical protein